MSEVAEMTTTTQSKEIVRSQQLGELQNIQAAYRLNGKNYLKWSQLVRTVLKGKWKISHLIGRDNQWKENKDNLWCTYCKKPRHTKEKCWKLNDSGATDHITSKSQLFHTYTPSPSNKKIAVANGSLATVEQGSRRRIGLAKKMNGLYHLESS
ncbi:hypothetical protein CK203_036884 [Vitis vinifera]|uniref:Retrovirus-related Pol polyprotein from transposon TNT 1-94-like beta-barrel domain-containing protein n=1 Tax=Vitis vinifera TaxID=29760 RepID=A0A438GXS5_VITVI|nr:hypothetical protein CK203_036884 [Vitis vinifera]